MESYGILPADRYKVITKSILTNIDKHNLITYYSPIIGPLAVSLYLLLWEDLNNKDESDFILHHHILNILKCNSNTLKESREKLESVGLLRSFVKEENVLVYIYELYAPLYPNEFLNHPILSIVLYNNIGKEEYDKIVHLNKKKNYDLSSYKEITKNLDEVYKSDNFNGIDDLKSHKSNDLKLTSKIDYDLILESIPEGTMSSKALNKKMKELIDNLSFIYNVDTLKMIEYIRMSINEFGLIDKKVLRENVKKYYQLSFNSMPTIVYRTQPEFLKKASGDTSLRAKTITMFENISPYDFLKIKNKGANPTSKDLKLVEMLLIDLELTPAVVNVLLDYCLKLNNNRLVSSYVETIAGQWKRSDLKTAEDAMKFAEKEYKKMHKKEYKSKKTEIVPSWINTKQEKSETTVEEIKELEELLKEFK